MRSTLESAPKTEGGVSSARGPAVCATVAGLDESGQMFRDTVSIIALDGRDCIFQAKSKPELNSWVLVEILPSKSGEKAISVQGQVVTLQPDGQAANQYRIQVELETKQDLKIGDFLQEMKAATPAPSRVPVPAPVPAASLHAPAPPAAPAHEPAFPAASGLTPAPMPAQISARPAAAAPVAPAAVKSTPVPVAKETPVKESAPKMAPLPPLSQTKTEPGAEWPAPVFNTQPKKIAVLPVPETAAPKTPSTLAALDKEIISAAVANEVKQQLAVTKTSLDRDLEKMVQGSVAQEVKQQFAAASASLTKDLEEMVQRAVVSGLDSMIPQAIEKKLSANFQSAIQTINDDLTFQLAGHVAKNEAIRGTIESLAKQTAAAQIAQWQETSGGNFGASEILQSLEKSVAEMQGRLKGAQENATSTIERLEAMDRQILDAAARLQKIVDQMNAGARATIDKFDSHIASELASWSEHIQNYADGVAQEKVAIFTSGLEHQVSTHMTEAQQLLEKLSEGARQAREVLQTQEIQLKERYQSIITDLEKEIRLTLLKIAGVA